MTCILHLPSSQLWGIALHQRVYTVSPLQSRVSSGSPISQPSSEHENSPGYPPAASIFPLQNTVTANKAQGASHTNKCLITVKLNFQLLLGVYPGIPEFLLDSLQGIIQLTVTKISLAEEKTYSTQSLAQCLEEIRLNPLSLTCTCMCSNDMYACRHYVPNNRNLHNLEMDYRGCLVFMFAGTLCKYYGFWHGTVVTSE